MPDNNELSERELEILKLVATGASNKEIAQQLYISANTVKVHLRNIFAKIGVTTRTEAAMYAVQVGLVQSATGAEVAVTETNETGELPLPGEGAATPVRNWRVYLGWGALAVVALLAVILILNIFPRQPQGQASTTPAVLPTEEPRWLARADVPTPRSGLAVAAFENRIYAIGGEDAQGVSGVVERYLPETDAWEQLSSKPTAVTDASAAVIGGKIYVPGGRTVSGALSATLEIYDPVQDRWENGAALPQPLSAYALVVFEGKLYLFGGWDGEQVVDATLRYDPGLDAWEELAPLRAARAYAGAAVANGRIFILGGFDGKNTLESVEIYQPAKESDEQPWTEGLPLPTGRYAMGATSAVDIIYIIGGLSDAVSESSITTPLPSLEYIPSGSIYQEFDAPVPETWSNLGMVLSGTQIYVLGGKLAQQPTGQNLAYQAIYTVAIPSIIK
jgi:DNA-binding CsgD family transcriptional regulator/N-acetylneuraminic acid mutarotase